MFGENNRNQIRVQLLFFCKNDRNADYAARDSEIASAMK